VGLLGPQRTNAQYWGDEVVRQEFHPNNKIIQ